MEHLLSLCFNTTGDKQNVKQSHWGKEICYTTMQAVYKTTILKKKKNLGKREVIVFLKQRENYGYRNKLIINVK